MSNPHSSTFRPSEKSESKTHQTDARTTSIVQDQQSEAIKQSQGRRWNTEEPRSYPNVLSFDPPGSGSFGDGKQPAMTKPDAAGAAHTAPPAVQWKDRSRTPEHTSRGGDKHSDSSYFSKSRLVMFADLDHKDPHYREEMDQEFARLKKAGAKYVGFEGLPSDFTPASLHPGKKLDELKAYLAKSPLDPESTIRMLKCCVAHGLIPVSLEGASTKTDPNKLVADMHSVVSDPAGKKAFDDYANDPTATADTRKGEKLRAALEKTLSLSPSQADQVMKDFDMMKKTGFDFKTVSRESASLVATERMTKTFTDELAKDPNLLKDYTAYVHAKVAARDGTDGGSASTLNEATARLKNDLSKIYPTDGSDPNAAKMIDSILRDTDKAIADKLDQVKGTASPAVLGTISKFLSLGVGTDSASGAMSKVESLPDADPTKAVLARVLGQLGGAFSDKLNQILGMDWRNRTMASILSKTLAKGKTVMFAGESHEQDNGYGIGTKDNPADPYGYLPRTMLSYLKEKKPKLREPTLIIKGKTYDPRDSAAINAAIHGE